MEKQDTCTICLERLPADSGALDCGHRFCFRCIDHWTRTSEFCPLCRKKSIYIKKLYRSFPIGEKIPIVVVPTTSFPSSSNNTEFLDLANEILEQEELDTLLSNNGYVESEDSDSIVQLTPVNNLRSITTTKNRQGIELTEDGIRKSLRKPKCTHISVDEVFSLLKEGDENDNDNKININNDDCECEVVVPIPVIRYIYRFLAEVKKKNKNLITDKVESRIATDVMEELGEMISANVEDALADAESALKRELLAHGIKGNGFGEKYGYLKKEGHRLQ